jgi:hypothetical protein
MNIQTTPAIQVVPGAGSAEACDSLLAEVDFKWLMAGQGWWIDQSRFRCDPLYAARLIRFGLTSQSFALRASAALIQIQMGGEKIA